MPFPWLNFAACRDGQKRRSEGGVPGLLWRCLEEVHGIQAWSRTAGPCARIARCGGGGRTATRATARFSRGAFRVACWSRSRGRRCAGRCRAPAAGEVLGGAGCLVGAKLAAGAASAGPAPGACGGHPGRQGLACLDAVGVHRGGDEVQRHAPGLAERVQVAALPAAIGRVPPGQRASCSARTEAASTVADVQFNSPAAPRSSKTFRCGRRHASVASAQAVQWRCALAGEAPYVSGRCRQAQPAGEDVHHSREHRVLRTGGVGRQQRSDQLPQFVRNQPVRQVNTPARHRVESSAITITITGKRLRTTLGTADAPVGAVSSFYPSSARPRFGFAKGIRIVRRGDIT
ncbi:hypothetical protein FHS40_006355 [Streptomyces spectabilis]|uniref:Uncharacterized protein n=1 Tax=Streptomyces spectabilis TaxID=68270 RepID=A0A7W8AZ52_STRST|nr:hypothetical protein [Streptomyces spectabilis]